MTSVSWAPSGGLVLEPNALDAARELKASLALTAGPGAGKTEMLAQRADFLLKSGVCRYPRRILAIAFKVDASQNLRDRVKTRCGNELASRFDSYTFHGFAKRIIDRFRPILSGQDALDKDYTIGERRVANKQITFDDLVPLATSIIEKYVPAKNSIRQTYTDIFLDEFQDCTKIQYSFLKAIFLDSSIRLTAVGDTKQKIMGWAGALEGIFLEYAKDFRAKPLNLYLNFRSKPRLLRMQNEIVKVLDPNSVMQGDQLIGGEGVIEVKRFQADQEEANDIAHEIYKWVNEENCPLSEIAILVAKLPDLFTQKLVEELKKLKIPYRREKDIQDISSEPISKLIIDFLLVIYGDREPVSYTRLISQIRNLGVDDDSDQERMFNWSAFLKEEKKRINQGSDVSIEDVWKSAKIFLKKFGKAQCISLSADYQKFERFNTVLKDFKQCLANQINLDKKVIKALNSLIKNEAVRIMSIHKCKGLEFEKVVVLGVEKEHYWGKIEDERCSFFVAISRAKQHLVLTCVESRDRPNGYTNRWDTARNELSEFTGYATSSI